MNKTEQPIEIQSPTQRAGIVAAFACLACMVCLFTVGKEAMEWLQLGRAEMLMIYTFIPFALTFAILYGSCIHRDMKKTARTLFLLLISLLIFGGACLALGAIAFFVLASMPLGRFHY